MKEMAHLTLEFLTQILEEEKSFKQFCQIVTELMVKLSCTIRSFFQLIMEKLKKS